MNNKKFLSILISFALIFSICDISLSMSGYEHKRLWGSIFGISGGRVESLWQTAQDVIDNFESDYRTLQKKFHWFKLGSSGHRLLFHWGFNTDVAKFPPLVSQVNKCLAGVPNADKERKNFFEALNKINRERQSRLTLSISNTLGVYSAAPAIAEIIHDVHILGDYTTTNIDGLPSVNNIKDSMLRSSTALIGYRNPSEKLRSLEREFKYAIDKAARGGDDRNKALNLIEAAKQFVPKILHERFYNDLSKKGISIRAN